MLELFKKLVITSITNQITKTFPQLLNETLKQLGLDLEIDYYQSYCLNWYNLIHKQSYIDEFISKTEIREIIIHSNLVVKIEINGRLFSKHIQDVEKPDYQLSLEKLCLDNGQNWNYSNPFSSFLVYFDNNLFRASLLHYSICSKQISKLSLRRLSTIPFKLNDFNLNDASKEIVEQLIHTKQNILISGSTGSGKTSFLTTMIYEIEKSQHVIILEDTYEIHSLNSNHTNLLANKSLKNKTLNDFCAYALRMRPDRLVVGEMRSDETIPFILAMNTGHNGLLSTIHADNGTDALVRTALLFIINSNNTNLSYQHVLKLICKNINYVIHLENKRVKEIIKVIGCDQDNPFVQTVL